MTDMRSDLASIPTRSPTLDYAKAQPRRWAIFLLGFLAVLFVTIVSIQWAWPKLKVAWIRSTFEERVKECLKWEAKPGTEIGPAPQCWDYFHYASGDPVSLVFMHERVSPSGARRLVIVLGQVVVDDWSTPHFTKPAPPNRYLLQKIHVIDTSTASPVRALETGGAESDFMDLGADRRVGFFPPFEFGQSRQFRLFCGAADLSDLSHFTIPFEVDAGQGRIEGWLRDDGTLAFKVYNPADEQ